VRRSLSASREEITLDVVDARLFLSSFIKKLVSTSWRIESRPGENGSGFPQPALFCWRLLSGGRARHQKSEPAQLRPMALSKFIGEDFSCSMIVLPATLVCPLNRIPAEIINDAQTAETAPIETLALLLERRYRE